ncbi:hypothetical protein MFAL_03870 [Mycolicibacterium fallax]|nr:hypothetical protein MFAL_03870 [Mycolicibacterium fallax]
MTDRARNVGLRRHRGNRCADKTATMRGCPTPHKLVWDSQVSALESLQYSHHVGRSHRPVRAYLCPCGRWHLTSIPKGEAPAG